MNEHRWQKIENLYYRALEHPSENRAAFLAAETAGDERLYEEVLSLLKSQEQTDDFLAEPEFLLGLHLLAKPKRAFKPEQEFGHYTILKFLGSGGMGEVYQARDTRLGRMVALKVLPVELASEQGRIRRFMQEARAASALNHPNILTIHEIGENDGWHFIAAEFIEGETLRKRLNREPAPDLAEILEIGGQVAAALNAAHKAGIIHRDIKPENIMLREDNLVKVLDFGLAKLTENLGDPHAAADAHLTNPGLVLGTVAYMSPEQARGKKIDGRADIWSLGVVLFEMLTGRLPFAGDSTSDIIAAILTAEPEFPLVEADEPFKGLWKIIARSLKKSPAERYQSAIDIAVEMKKIPAEARVFARQSASEPKSERTVPARIDTNSQAADSGASVSQPAHGAFKPGKNRPVAIFVLLFLIISVSGFAIYYFSTRSGGQSPAMKITRILDTGKTLQAAISPDGKYLAHIVGDGGQSSLWVKHIATNSSVQLIPPSAVSYSPLTFSADGNYIFYVSRAKGAGGSVYQIPVLGGEPRNVLENVGGAVSLSPDGEKIAFVRDLSATETALMIADLQSGEERRLSARQKPDYLSVSGHAWSPDGKIIACVTGSASGERVSQISLFSVENGSEKPLPNQKWRYIDRIQWVSDGSGIIGAAMETTGQEASQLWLFPYPAGQAQRITNDLNDYGGVSLTADSRSLVALQFEIRQNIWVSPNVETGEARSITDHLPDNYRFVSWTPDKKIIYPSLNSGNRDLWVMNEDGGTRRQLTATPHNDILPDASPDGKYIAFASNRSPAGTVNIWRINADGTNPVQITGGKDETFPKFTPDGKWLVYVSGGNDSPTDQRTIWKVPVEGGDPVQLTVEPSFGADVSPDGKHFACWYKAEKSAPWKIAVIPIEGGAPVKLLAAAPTSQLKWLPDSTAIAYVKTENGVSNIWSQPLTGDAPKQLTRFTSEQIFQFDLAGDSRLVVSRGTSTRSAILISNFR